MATESKRMYQRGGLAADRVTLAAREIGVDTDAPHKIFIGSAGGNIEIGDALELYSVRRFGAALDGSTNDSAAVINSLNELGLVLFPEGAVCNLGSGLDLSGNDLRFIGVSPMPYTLGVGWGAGGVKLIGPLRVTGNHCEVRNISMAGSGELLQLAGDNGRVDNCIAVAGGGVVTNHNFFIGAGHGSIISRCRSYGGGHGYAVRARGVKVLNCLAVNSAIDNIIISAGSGEHNEDVQISGFTGLTLSGECEVGIFVKAYSDSGSTLKGVSINNFRIQGANFGVLVHNENSVAKALRSVRISSGEILPAGIGLEVRTVADGVRIANVDVFGGTDYGFWSNDSDRVLFANCSSYDSGNLGFNLYNGDKLALVNCFVDNAAGTAFYNQGCTETPAINCNATNSGLIFGGSTPFENVFSGNVSVYGDCSIGGIARLSGSRLDVLNKAGNGWLQHIVRDTAGAEAVYHHRYIGYLEMPETGDPAAGGSDTGRLYTRDNGAGKTQLCVRFATGAVQVIASEP